MGLDVPRGVRIDNVVKGSAGEAAGLKEGDVILSVDGQETNESNQLQGLIAVHHAGDNVSLKIWRDGKEIEKNVTLRPRTDLASNDKSDEVLKEHLTEMHERAGEPAHVAFGELVRDERRAQAR